MSIFDSIGRSNPADSTIDPKQLFRVLPKPQGSPYRFPHDIQSEVWDKWFARRDEPDLVVKMNTGSGKTVIGLVILKSSLNEGKGPAVYLVPDTQLKSQVQKTAEALGIAWTEDLDDPIFRQSQAVLITTVHTMFNGRSRFGVRGATGRPIQVGTVVIDDAHACIPIVEHQFSMAVPATSPQYQALLDIFGDALKTQSLASHTAINAREGTQSVPVPYWEWQPHHEAAFRLLNTFATDSQQNSDAMFSWPMIRDHIELCDVAFSPKQIEVRLPYPDLTVIPSFVGAERRIYMTATLADNSILTTHMGVASQCVTSPVAPASASDLGDRLILTPIETSRQVSHDDVRLSAQRWAQQHNVVVIVPSKFRAAVWEDVTSEIHDRTSIQSVVTRLNSGHVGLVVLIARYDGVDLPGEACRVLILDGLPERYSPLEQIEATALGGTEAMDVRQVQRIEQGMGRGVRSTDDYCAVVLLDPRLVERLYTASSKSQLSPATRAQYELSSTFSAGGRGKPMSFFEEATAAFLRRDGAWVGASKQAVSEVTYDQADTVPAEVIAERQAFDLALAGRAGDAAATLQQIYDGVSDAQLRGWLKQRGAAYLNLGDPERARGLQRSARIDNNFILKIPNEVSARRLSAHADQAAASVEFMTRTYSTSRNFEIGIEALLRDLTPSTEAGSYKRFEAAFETLGYLLGFDSSRPDQETNIGPDNFWAIGGGRHWVVEAKSESTATTISRDYLEQLSHSADWFDAENNGRAVTQTPILIHPSRTPHWDAVPRQGAVVMTFDRLADFREAVQGFANALTTGERYRDRASVEANLRQFHLTAGELTQKWTQDYLPSGPRP